MSILLTHLWCVQWQKKHVVQCIYKTMAKNQQILKLHNKKKKRLSYMTNAHYARSSLLLKKL